MEFNSLNNSSVRLRNMILEADDIVAFTGAGISTESGIPDFRSPTGLWSRMEPIQFAEFLNSEEARLEDWRRRFIMNKEFAQAKPNEGHLALARLEEAGKLACTITQNIDGLHQRSGLSTDKVIELHGNATYGTCLECGEPASLSDIQHMISETGKSPRCTRCNGLIKAAVISFGQAMPQREMTQAMHQAADCDLFIVLGSSLVVYPAANLPQIAKQSGAQLVIINRDATPLDRLADLCIHDEIGLAMAQIP